MKVQYIGKSFGVDSLTNGKIYECIGIEDPFLRIIDDSEEDYLYAIKEPGDHLNSSAKGVWKVIEDDKHGTLNKLING